MNRDLLMTMREDVLKYRRFGWRRLLMKLVGRVVLWYDVNDVVDDMSGIIRVLNMRVTPRYILLVVRDDRSWFENTIRILDRAILLNDMDNGGGLVKEL